ncbi:very short patch repair endonuclease [Erythrobacter sp. CCH5-A1]|uniref:very short patch repair endonuclease n=1 Tax=Erythrobacter sp. CCH5-A1 TaxID=1768792 RepID=UPI0009E66243|nr:DNA mismatch endonuclease Vsr [Erythrobacter sp. CCH5-A1]
MADIVDPRRRSEMMAGIRGKDTKPELVVRRLLHSRGYRFRLHRKDLPGKPDIVLAKWNTVIFVHGCFWHGHTNCSLFRLPKSRTEFWEAKIATNQARDKEVKGKLSDLGWKTIEIWECSSKGKGALPAEQMCREIDHAIRQADLMNYEVRGFQIA